MSRRASVPNISPMLDDVARGLQATPARLAVLASLSVDGAQTSGRLSARLGLSIGALQHHLTALRELGLIVALPLEEPDHCHRLEYHVVAQRLIELHKALGSELGIPE
jgi:DNA-binding transcriptional ArsR family regulator